MKRVILVSLGVTISTIFASGQSQQSAFSGLSGPYLGQTLPGNSPEVFAKGIISTAKHECQIVASPDGKELYYSVLETSNNGLTVNCYYTRETNGSWSNPVKLPFSGTYEDGYLAMNLDGSRLYFQSNRPINPDESTYTYNIWYVDKNGEGWTAPRSIGKPINGVLHTSGPSINENDEFFFTRMVIGGSNEIFMSKVENGIYQQPERLPNAINSSRQQFDSYISPDGRFLLFGSYLRSDTYGGTDLYVAFRDNNGRWLSAINLGPKINTADDEGSATISSDGKLIFFSRYNNNPTKNLNIFWMSTGFIDSLRQSVLTSTDAVYLPSSFRIEQCYPNPVAHKVKIPFYADQDVSISLSIFNVNGIRVLAPIKSVLYFAGFHDIDLDTDLLENGVYYYQIEADAGTRQSEKMLVIH